MDTFNRFLLSLIFLILFAVNFGCAAKKEPLMLSVTSQPEGALCTVHGQREESVGKPVMVAGVTPVEFPVTVYGNESLWLKVEQRGYHPFIQKIRPDSAGPIPAVLKKNDKVSATAETGFTAIKKIVILAPEMEVILRGTIGNASPEEEVRKVSDIIGEKISSHISSMVPAIRLDMNASTEKSLNAIWRDSRTAMEIMDPIRLKYLMSAPRLETSSGRRRAKEIGETYDADAVLLVSGRVDREGGL